MAIRFLSLLIGVLFLVNSFGTAYASSFSDLLDTNPRTKAVEYLKERNIFSGYSDGSFKPMGLINRAELLKILVLSAPGITEQMVDNYFQQNYLAKNYSYATFPDVLTDVWYAKYIAYAYGLGWVSGHPDGTFKPANNVNLVEALKMVFEANDLEASDSDFYSVLLDGLDQNKKWYADYLAVAAKYTILSFGTSEEFAKTESLGYMPIGFIHSETDFLVPGSLLTRQNAAELLYRVKYLKENSLTCYIPNVSEWSIYNDPVENFSVKLPPSWTVKKEEFTDDDSEIVNTVKLLTFAYVKLFPYSQNFGLAGWAPFNMRIYNLNNAGVTINNWLDDQFTKSALEDATFEEYSMNGLQGKKFHSLAAGQPSGVIIKKDSNIYWIVVNSTEGPFDCGFEDFYKSFALK